MYNFNTTASFDVDAENGFTELCPGELPVMGGQDIVPALNAQAKYAKYRVFSKDWHNPNSVWVATESEPQFNEVGLPNSDIRWNMHCGAGTYGAQLIDGLPTVTDYDFGVYKGLELDMHPYGACYHDLGDKISTGVIEFLRDKGVATVIVGGLATDYCVKFTVLQLLKADFNVILNRAACRGIALETVEPAIEEMKDAGATVIYTTTELKQLVTEEN